MAYLVKNHEDILRRVLAKIQKDTSITSIAPGSVMRAFAEAITTELGDFYQILDFNFNQSMISTAQGQALDLIGELYNVQRKTLTQIAAIDASLGSFYFYIETPAASSIIIPKGTRVYTNSTGLIGEVFTYQTTSDCVIASGHTRAYASIAPAFTDSVYTAGPHTLTMHNFTNAPSGTLVLCTNPKAIQAQVGKESDDSYRVRIIKSIRTSAGGTSEAVRFAALAIPGVRDVSIRNATYGLGSFEVIVIIESQALAQSVLTNVERAIETVRPVGVAPFIKEPEKLPISVTVELLLKNRGQNTNEALQKRAEVAILRYLNTMLIGTPFIYNQLIQSIFESAPDVIADVTVSSLLINGTEMVRRNFNPRADQLITPGNIKVNVASI